LKDNHVPYAFLSPLLQLNYKRAAALVKAHVAGETLPGKPPITQSNFTIISKFLVRQPLMDWLSGLHIFVFSQLSPIFLLFTTI
jgi:hypothetical protein